MSFGGGAKVVWGLPPGQKARGGTKHHGKLWEPPAYSLKDKIRTSFDPLPEELM